MNELKQKNIVISAVEITNWGVKVKDEQNLIYNVSQTKKDGTPTAAYQALTALPNNGMGMTKCFKFVEVPNKRGGMSRYVRMIVEPQASPIIQQPQPITPQNAQNAPVSGFQGKEVINKEDAIYRSVAVKSVYPVYKKMSEEAIKEMNDIVNYIKTGKGGMVNVEEEMSIPPAIPPDDEIPF